MKRVVTFPSESAIVVDVVFAIVNSAMLCCVPNVVLRLPQNKYVVFHLFLVFE